MELQSAQTISDTDELRSTERRRPSLGGFLRGLWTAWLERERIRRDRAHLASLPDYLLRDIGLTREDVTRIDWRSWTDGRGPTERGDA